MYKNKINPVQRAKNEREKVNLTSLKETRANNITQLNKIKLDKEVELYRPLVIHVVHQLSEEE